MCRQEDQRSCRQTPEHRKPLSMRSKRSDEGEIGPCGQHQPVQDLTDQHKMREGVHLQSIPVLNKGISAHCHRIGEGREIYQEPVTEGCGEKIICRRPPGYQLVHNLLSQGPFRAEDLVTTAQRVCYNVLGPLDKLGNQRQVCGLCPTEKMLRLLVERHGEHPPCLLIYDRAVVLSVKTPTVKPCRDWPKCMSPR